VLLAMAQLIYYENRGFAEISRMLMTLGDIEVSTSRGARFTDIDNTAVYLAYSTVVRHLR